MLLLHRGANGVSGHLIIVNPRHVDIQPTTRVFCPILSTVKYFAVVVALLKTQKQH